MLPFVPRQSAEAHVTCMCRKEIAWKDMDDWRTLVHEHAIDFNKETSLKVSCPVGFFFSFWVLGPIWVISPLLISVAGVLRFGGRSSVAWGWAVEGCGRRKHC